MLPIAVPDPGPSSQPIRVSAWLVEPGDEVLEGDRVVELLLPGITFDVTSPVAGTVAQCVRMLDEVVSPGDVLAWVIPSTTNSSDSTGNGPASASDT
jgi:pyruvate/2-oxoglutarate dehydrogenase complex dihydrolipoamide acyltransferase (E2) component